MPETLYTDNNYMIAWTFPDDPTPRLEVGPWPDRTHWSDSFLLTTGCCDLRFLDLPEVEQAQRLLNLAFELIVQFDIPPDDVLREFCKIGIWCDMGIALPSGDYERAFHENDPLQFSPHNTG